MKKISYVCQIDDFANVSQVYYFTNKKNAMSYAKKIVNTYCYWVLVKKITTEVVYKSYNKSQKKHIENISDYNPNELAKQIKKNPLDKL